MIWVEIPKYPNYLINTFGDIKTKNGKIVTPYVNSWGYHTVSLRNKSKATLVLVHRLVATTFIEDNFDNVKLVVNHRNLDKSDNHYSNLEWLTIHENNIHAGIVRGNRHFCSIYATSIVSGEKLSFHDVFSCADKLELDWLDVWDSIRIGDHYAGWKIEFSGLNNRIPSEFHKSSIEVRDVVGRKPKRKIRVKNVLTDETKMYSSISDFCKETSISSKNVNVVLQKRHLGSLLYKKYQITYAEEEPFHIAPERLEYLINYGSKEVLSVDLRDKVVTKFPSATKMYMMLGLKKAGVTEALRKEGFGVSENYLFVYNERKDLKEILAAIHNCPEL